MYSNLFEIFDGEIAKLEDDKKTVSDKTNKMKEVYDKIKPKNKEVRYLNLGEFADEKKKEKLEDCLNLTCFVEEYEIEEIMNVLNTKKKYEQYCMDLKRLISRNSEISKIMEDEKLMLEFVKESKNLQILKFFNEIQDSSKKINNAKNEMYFLLKDIANNIVRDYEAFYCQYNQIKEELKTMLRLKKEVLNNNEISPFLVVNAINLIMNSDYDESVKNNAIKELNDYNLVKQKEKQTTHKKPDEKKQVNVKTLIITIEPELETKEEVSKRKKMAINYLETLKSYPDYFSKNEMLDSLKLWPSFERYLDEMIILANDKFSNKEDLLLLEYLINYRDNLIVDDVVMPDEQKQNMVFYCGLSRSEPFAYSDVCKMPKEYFDDVKTTLLRIKNGEFTNNIKTQRKLVELDKIYEMKSGNVRTAYKKIGSNTYVVLLIYIKKMERDIKFIDKVKKRNGLFKIEEKAIKKAFLDDALYEKLCNRTQKDDELFNELLFLKKNKK
ncbi:MAG: hypothetical protein RSA10_01000 [Bacilli bacterium]